MYIQSCLTLWDPRDYSPPASSVHGILRQEYWSGLPCCPPGDFPHVRIEPVPLIFPALARGSLQLSHLESLKNDRMISGIFCFCSPPPQGKPFSITIIQVYIPTTDAKEAEVDWFPEELQDMELTHTHKRKMSLSS